MFTQKQAAEYFVVAWCRNWTLTEYLKVVLERPKLTTGGGEPGDQFKEVVAEAVAAFPWLTDILPAYPRQVREYVGGAYPKLSAWLWSRESDVARLKCAEQIQKLRPPARMVGYVSAEDRDAMKRASKEERANTASWRLSRDSFKTHQRSAWNVCKA